MLHLSEARRIVFVALHVAQGCANAKPSTEDWLAASLPHPHPRDTSEKPRLCRLPRFSQSSAVASKATCHLRVLRAMAKPELDSISGCLIAFEVTSELGLQHSLQVLGSTEKAPRHTHFACSLRLPSCVDTSGGLVGHFASFCSSILTSLSSKLSGSSASLKHRATCSSRNSQH